MHVTRFLRAMAADNLDGSADAQRTDGRQRVRPKLPMALYNRFQRTEETPQASVRSTIAKSSSPDLARNRSPIVGGTTIDGRSACQFTAKIYKMHFSVTTSAGDGSRASYSPSSWCIAYIVEQTVRSSRTANSQSKVLRQTGSCERAPLAPSTSSPRLW